MMPPERIAYLHWLKTLPVVVVLCLTLACKDDGYVIVTSKRYVDPQRVPENNEMILYTIKHGNTTITAHCEVLYSPNHCRDLEVGRSYQLKREKFAIGGSDYLTTENPHAVLSVESETMR
jgi:hypothetical protein